MMPDPTRDLPLQTTQRAAFGLPCAVTRAVMYLSDPTITLGGLPSVERIVLRQRGSYRLTFRPIQVPGFALRPAAEVRFTTGADRVSVTSVPEEPHHLQPGEVAARIAGLFIGNTSARGCMVRATLTIDAVIPARVLPSLMPRALALGTIEALLTHRMKREVATLAHHLVNAFGAWEAEWWAKPGA